MSTNGTQKVCTNENFNIVEVTHKTYNDDSWVSIIKTQRRGGENKNED